MAADVVKLTEAKTVNGAMVAVKVEGGTVMINGAKVTDGRYRSLERRHPRDRHGADAADELDRPAQAGLRIALKPGTAPIGTAETASRWAIRQFNPHSVDRHDEVIPANGETK